MKKENIITAVVIAAVLALYIVIQFDKHTVMGEELDMRLGDDVELLQLDVTVYDQDTENHLASAHITMSADEVERLFDEFGTVGLKRVGEFRANAKYRLHLSYNKQVRNNHYQEHSLVMDLSDDQIFLNVPYEVKEDNLVEVFESFIDDEGVQVEELR